MIKASYARLFKRVIVLSSHREPLIQIADLVAGAIMRRDGRNDADVFSMICRKNDWNCTAHIKITRLASPCTSTEGAGGRKDHFSRDRMSDRSAFYRWSLSAGKVIIQQTQAAWVCEKLVKKSNFGITAERIGTFSRPMIWLFWCVSALSSPALPWSHWLSGSYGKSFSSYSSYA